MMKNKTIIATATATAPSTATKDWIKKALAVHHDKDYDYSKTKYVKRDTPVIIICKKDGHGEFTISPRFFLIGPGCPVCRKTTIPYEKSFASHEKADCWSDKNILKPHEVALTTKTKYYFDCECGHESFTAPNDMVGRITGCGYCCPAPRLLCSDNADGKCKTCYNKSFASHPRGKNWSREDNMCEPWEVFMSADKQYTFKCSDCLHKFTKKLSDISNRDIPDRFCPYCSNPPRQLCDDDCDHCYNNSFASHPKAHLWSDDNEKTARNTFKNSNKKIKFDCSECGNEYINALNDVARGRWCTCTRNKTEAKLFKYLTANYDQEIKDQEPFDWCINPENNRKLPFDFLIEEFKLVIELDGAQHFVQVSNWEDPISRQKTDIYKTKCANKKGYSVIRLLQEDVWNDKNNWQENLLNSIKKYDTVTNIFFGDCYDNHKIVNEPLPKLKSKSKLKYAIDSNNKPFPRSIPKHIVDTDNDSYEDEIDHELIDIKLPRIKPKINKTNITVKNVKQTTRTITRVRRTPESHR